MSKNKNVVFAADAATATGFVPDPSLQPLNLSQTRLDASDVGLDDDKQLWLLQLPHDFPSGASVCWAISDDPPEGLRGRCTVQDVEYLLVPEDAAMTASLYATPSSAQGCVAPIARRMTVVRASQAPLLCFGDDGKQQRKQTVAGKQQGSGAAAAALSPAAGDKIARKKKRHSEAAAAAQQQEPQRQQQEGGTAQAAGAAPAAEQQQAEGSAVKQQQKQQKAKRKHEQGEAAVAAPEAAALPSAEKKAKRKKSQRSEKP